jgi:hypothetical protein
MLSGKEADCNLRNSENSQNDSFFFSVFPILLFPPNPLPDPARLGPVQNPR